MTSGHVQHSFTSGVRATADRSTLQGESEDDIAAALADHLRYHQAIPLVTLTTRHDCTPRSPRRSATGCRIAT